MLISQGANQGIVGSQLGGVRFSGQDGGADGVASRTFDIPDEIRERPSLSDEIIDQEVVPTALHLANEQSLVREPLKPARPGVADRI